MDNLITIGVLKETKNPPDRRVAITPEEGANLIKQFPFVDLYIQSSEFRCYSDDEYRQYGLPIVKNVSFCDILVGVKEVAIQELIANKKYMFFSHTTKKQSYNKKLLQTVLKKNITLIDYELLTNSLNVRLVAFSRWAGIIGCYNGLIALGKRSKLFNLKPAFQLKHIYEMFDELSSIKIPSLKILITGHGRAGSGAAEILNFLEIHEVTPTNFLNKTYNHPVFSILDPHDYVARKDNKVFTLQHFYNHPDMYKSIFTPFTKVADLLMPCHYWDPKSPPLMTKEEMQEVGFNITVIADVSCDIDGPIPSTIRPSKIDDPIYGYNPLTGKETSPFEEGSITVMAVDNLPGELPRDASSDFSKTLLETVYPSLIEDDCEKIIERATIASNGKLKERYSYLEEYVKD